MDPLSELMTHLKTRSYITAGFDAGGSWALTLDDLVGRIKCYVVVKGRCWLSMADGDGPHLLQEGDCFILPSGRNAQISSDLKARPKLASDVLNPDRSGEIVTYNGGGDVFLVGSRFDVNGRQAEFLLQTLPPLIRVETSGDRDKLKLYIDLMMEELREGRPGSAQVAQNLSQMILAQALRLYLSNRPETDVGWFAALADPRLTASITAIHSEPSYPWTLDDLARKAGMSRSSFARHFRERVGETPITYLTQWRMMSASEKLVSGKDTIAQIAISLGYSSEHAFNTAFKRIMGQSPGRYARARQTVSGNLSSELRA